MKKLSLAEIDLLTDKEVSEYISELTSQYLTKPSERKRMAKEVFAVIEYRQLRNDSTNTNRNKGNE